MKRLLMSLVSVFRKSGEAVKVTPPGEIGDQISRALGLLLNWINAQGVAEKDIRKTLFSNDGLMMCRLCVSGLLLSEKDKRNFLRAKKKDTKMAGLIAIRKSLSHKGCAFDFYPSSPFGTEFVVKYQGAESVEDRLGFDAAIRKYNFDLVESIDHVVLTRP